jgi:5-(aminomethyl)-3-furanmethanol phosphate kinase
MIIIKLGGSLEASGALIACLNNIARNYQGRTVIVPGGGVFADQVRLAQKRWHFDGDTAHAMAILAMQQMALLFKGLKAGFVIARNITAIQYQLNQQKIVIWSPDGTELESAGIAPSWDITSDSLAAWLAKALSADELILIKSAEIDANLSLAELAERGIVDKAFCTFNEHAAYKITIMNKQDF